MITLKNDYKELCRLKGYIDLAENDHFLRGPLYPAQTPFSASKNPQADIGKEPQTNASPAPSSLDPDESISH